MNTNTIGRVLCKIAAVYFVVQAAQGIAQIVPFAFGETTGFVGFLLTLLLVVGAPLVVAFLLWKFADRLAGTNAPESEQAISTELTKDDLLEAGLVLIGVVAILFGIADAIPMEMSDLWYRLSQDEEGLFLDQTLIYNWGRRLGYITQIVLGFVLIYGKQSIIAYIHKARRAGARRA